MARTSSAQRMRALRERQRQGEAPDLRPCIACGRKTQQRQQGERTAAGAELLCSACWRRSPAGKAARAERVRQRRALLKAQQQGQG